MPFHFKMPHTAPISSFTILLTTIIFSTTLVASSVAPDGAPTTCYLLNGKQGPRAGFRCNNGTTGESSCCSPGAICFSNGVCQQANGNVQDFLRVGCTDPTWNDPACLRQCAPFGIDTAGIRFCDGAITATTSYCCDNGTAGIGSFACCGTPGSIFNIAPAPTVLAQMPLSQVPLSTASSTASSSTASSSSNATTPISAEMNLQMSSPNGSSGGVIAAAVIVVLAFISLIIGGLLYRRHQRKPLPPQSFPMTVTTIHRRSLSPEPRKNYYDSSIVHEADSNFTPIDRDSKKGYIRDDEIADALTDKDIEAGLQRPTKVFEMA